MNKTLLIGRLTRDPELKYTANNIPVATFTLAVNRPFSKQGGERKTDFINIVVWRKQAENVKNYITQGSLVAVEGRIQTRNYEAKDGTKRYVTEIVADNVQFLETKKQAELRAQNIDVSVDIPNDNYIDEEVAPTTDIEEDPFADFGANIEISDDELPF
jgi:single-strand DNA-binding protein